MIKVTKQEHNTIFYSCDCGANGMCSIKPLSKNSAIVIVITCPICKESEKITLLQYDSDKGKQNLMENLNNIDFSWCPTFNEEI